MPNSQRRAETNENANEPRKDQLFCQDLFEDELQMKPSPPPPFVDQSSPPALEFLENFLEKRQENLQREEQELRKQQNCFPSHISLFDEILPPLLPPRRFSHPQHQQILAQSGQCKAPKLTGQGYDPPFPYPHLMSQCREQRASYIFGVIDKLALQIECCLNRLQSRPEKPVPMDNSVKSSTGTVPKPRRLESTVKSSHHAAKRSFRKQQKQLKKEQQQQKQQQQIMDAEFDLDCEFGMEYIQKFRDNNIRPSEIPLHTGPNLDKDEGISSDSSASARPFIDLPMTQPKLWLPPVQERPTRPCSPEETKSPYPPLPPLTLNDWSFPKVSNKQQEQEKQQQRENPQPEEIVKLQESQSKESLPKELEKEQTEEDEEKLKQQQEEAHKAINEWHLRCTKRRQERMLRRFQQKRKILFEMYETYLRIQREYKEEGRERRLRRRRLGKPECDLSSPMCLVPYTPSNCLLKPNIYEFRKINSLGCTRLVPAYIQLPEDILKKIMGKDLGKSKKTPFKIPYAKPCKYYTFPSESFRAVRDDEKRVCKLRRNPQTASFINKCYKPSKTYDLDPEKSFSRYCMEYLVRRRRIVAKQPYPMPKPVIPAPEPPKPEPPRPKYIDNPDDPTEIRLRHKFLDTRTWPILPDLSKAMKKPNAVAVIYVPHETQEEQEEEQDEDPEEKPRKRRLKLRKNQNSKTENDHKQSGKERYRVMTKWQLLPKVGDFRSFFEIDIMSIQILERMAQQGYYKQKDFRPSSRIMEYLEHFYRQRSIKDTMNFHWYVNEGFFAAHLLLEQPHLKPNPLRGQLLEKLSNSEIDAKVLSYLKERNVKRKCPPIQLTGQMAYYMVTSYCRLLLKNATQSERPAGERFLLRTRFAVSNIEGFMLELNANVLKDEVNCAWLMKWSFIQESRVRDIYGEAMRNAQERADLTRKKVKFVMRAPNLESFYDFYNENQFPRPDALAINPLMNNIRRYQMPQMEYGLKRYPCPIRGCPMELCSTTLLAHFLSDHCRRLEELWLGDHMLFVFHPQSYPPEQIFCICGMALMPREPTTYVPHPTRILNYELAPHQLYFAEHTPCLLMYSQIGIDCLLEADSTESDSSSPRCFLPQRSLYVFWLGSSDDHRRDYTCQLSIYGREKSMPCRGPLKPIKMSRFMNVPHMMGKYEGRYIAIDYASMSTLTYKFRELIYIEVHYKRLHDTRKD